MTKATYCKLLADGSYEYGVIIQAANRKRDKLQRIGVAANYEDAVRMMRTI